MIGTILLDVFILAIALGGVQMYLEAHVGIDNLTQKIKTPWLRTTISVALKVGAATLILVGLIGAIICAIAFSQDNKKGKG